MARGGSLNLATAMVGAAATTACTVLVTREFPKPVAGAFFTATSAFIIVRAIGGLGAYNGLTYFVARLRSLGQDHRIPAIMKAAIVPTMVASAVVTVLMLLLAGPLAHLMLAGHSQEAGVTPADVTYALRALALALPFAGLFNAYLGATRGYRDMKPTAFISQLGLPVAQLLAIVGACVAGSAALLAPLWVVPYIPAAVLTWLWLRRIRRKKATRRFTLPALPPEFAALLALATPMPADGLAHTETSARPMRTEPGKDTRLGQRQLANTSTRGFWRFTTPRAIANLAQNILQRIDIVLVAIMRGPAEAAVYTAATRFLIVGQFGNMAINMAAQPRFTEFFALRDVRGANIVYQATTAWLILLTWPLYLLAVTFGPQVLTIFGRSYRAGDAVVVILGLAMLLGTACGQVDVVLITSGRSTWSLINGLMAVGVNVGVDIALIPRYGITGAAIGWAVAIAVTNLMPLMQLAVVERLHPFGRGTFAACAVAALAFCAVPLGLRAILGHGAADSVIAVGIGCLVYAAGLWRYRNLLWLSAMPGLSAIKNRALSFIDNHRPGP